MSNLDGFRSAEPRDLLLYVLSSVFSCQLTKIRNVVQERVHDHISYSGELLFVLRCMGNRHIFLHFFKKEQHLL